MLRIRRAVAALFGRKDAAAPLWHPERGGDYKDFWTGMSRTEADSIIATYGKMADEEERIESCRYIARHIIESLRIDATKDVLEIGCGIGMFARLVGPECRRYTGADISPNMVAQAQAFAAKADKGQLEFAVLPRSDLQAFADESFDAVFFEAVLMHLAREDAFNYLCEAHRVLRPKGRLYATFQNLLHPDGFVHFLRMATQADRTGRHAVGRVRFHTAPELRQLAEGAGFAIDERYARLQLRENDPTRHEARTLTIVAEKSVRPDRPPDGDWPY